MCVQYGVDISSRRIDDLDKLLLQTVANATKPTILELGCGHGGLTYRLIDSGAHVYAVDISDYTSELDTALRTGKVSFVVADMRTLPANYLSRSYDACVVQRSLHYIRQPEAVRVLRQLRTLVTGALYLSVTGIETDIASYYPATDTPLTERFASLHAPADDLFSITAPLCLYRKEEIIATISEAGWQIDKIWTSAFGNHKLICR